MKCIAFLLLFIISSLQSISQTATPEVNLGDFKSLDELMSATVFLQEGNFSGSGTIIQHNEKLFLVTAQHISSILTENSIIVFRLEGDKALIAGIKKLTYDGSLNWLIHPVADLAILEITTKDKSDIDGLKKIAFPSNLIFTWRDGPFNRAFDIHFIGYPLLDLQQQWFSPLYFKTKLASGIFAAKRYDLTDITSMFFALQMPSMQGVSGGGVYSSVQEPVTIGEKTFMIGLMHGCKGDISGGKLAMVTPSNYIWDLIADK